MVLKGFRVDDLRTPRRDRDGADPEAARLPGAARTSSTGTASAASPSTSSRRRCRRSSRSSPASSASTARSARRARSSTASTRAARSAARTARGRPPRSASSPRRKGFDLAASTAYSDSHTDLPFLEAVGNPVVVNPDRELRRIAVERGWPILEFDELAYPAVRRLHPALIGLPIRRRRRRRGVGCQPAACGLRSGSPRSDSPRRTRQRSPSTSSTPSRAASSATGSAGSTGSRRSATCSRTRSPSRLHAEPGYERWDGNGALGYLTLAAIVDAQLDRPARARARRRRLELLPDRRARLVRAPARRGRAGRRPDRDLAGSAAAPGGR